MKQASSRTLEALSPVLKDTSAKGPDPVYWVFNEIGGKWENITLITAGNYSGEYPKTFGHYHGVNVPEIYHLVSGDGVLVLQKKKVVQGKWIEEEVEEVVMIKAKPGDEVVITPEWGHSWYNVGPTALISYDDWRSGHNPSDYEPIEKLKGLAYYLVEENGALKVIANPNYRNSPQPVWLTAQEFREKYSPS